MLFCLFLLFCLSYLPSLVKIKIYILLLSGLPDRHHGITDKSHIFVRKFVVCHLSVHQKL